MGFSSEQRRPAGQQIAVNTRVRSAGRESVRVLGAQSHRRSSALCLTPTARNRVTSVRGSWARARPEFARAQVGYKAPEEIVFLDEIPLNPTGKVDQVALKPLTEDHLHPHGIS